MLPYRLDKMLQQRYKAKGTIRQQLAYSYKQR